LDEIAQVMRNVTLGTASERTFKGSGFGGLIAGEAPTGIEPVYTALQAAA
jgi:hypothetical protein